MFDEAKLNTLFMYHAPTEPQIQSYQAIREKARELAGVIVDHTPPSADQSAAIRLLREAVMTANASIATGGVS